MNNYIFISLIRLLSGETSRITITTQRNATATTCSYIGSFMLMSHKLPFSCDDRDAFWGVKNHTVNTYSIMSINLLACERVLSHATTSIATVPTTSIATDDINWKLCDHSCVCVYNSDMNRYNTHVNGNMRLTTVVSTAMWPLFTDDTMWLVPETWFAHVVYKPHIFICIHNTKCITGWHWQHANRRHCNISPFRGGYFGLSFSWFRRLHIYLRQYVLKLACLIGTLTSIYRIIVYADSKCLIDFQRKITCVTHAKQLPICMYFVLNVMSIVNLYDTSFFRVFAQNDTSDKANMSTAHTYTTNTFIVCHFQPQMTVASNNV